MLKKKSSSNSAAEKLARAKALLGDLKKKGEGGGNFFKLEDGKNIFRILPLTTTEGDFFRTTKKHFNVGPNEDQFIACPTSVNKKCAICAAGKKETDKKEARKLWPRTSYAMVVLSIFPEKDLKKPKVLEVGTMVFKQILAFYTDADEYGNILELDGGRDIMVTKSGKGMTTEYEVKLRDTERSATVSDKVLDLVNEKGPDLDKIYDESTYPSYAKTEAVLEGVELEEDDDDEDVEEKPRQKKSKEKNRKARFNREEEEDEKSEDDEDDEDEDEEPTKSKKKTTKKDEDDEEESEDDSSDEEEDEDEEDSEDEEEEEEDSEGDDEDDEDGNEDDEEESESKASAIKKRLKAKAKK